MAVLPFLVEQYGPYDGPTFIVSKIANSRLLDDEQFVPEREAGNLERRAHGARRRNSCGPRDRRAPRRAAGSRARVAHLSRSRSTVRRPTNCGSMSATAPRAARGASCECRGASCDLTRPRPDTAPALAARVSSASDPSENASAAPKKLMFAGKVWEAEQRRSATRDRHLGPRHHLRGRADGARRSGARRRAPRLSARLELRRRR